MLFIGAAFSLGVSLVVGWRHFVSASRPDQPILLGHDVRERVPGGSWWLSMHWRVRAAAPCIRQGVQLIYRDTPNQPRDYYSLGSSLNGGGLKGSVNDYVIWFAIPRGLPPGDWQFLFRSFYSCPPFGLVLWETTTEPVTVTIPPPPPRPQSERR